jgi:hypothetical protein
MANHISSNQLRFAGDVNISKAVIVSSKGVYQNITNQILQVRVYEDLFSPFITGSLIIKESFDFTNLLPLVGEEYIELKIVTPTVKQGTIEGTFHIYKMSDKTKFGDRSTAYELNFISIESLIDTNKKISKVFAGKISDIVTTLASDKVDGLETKKKILVENTRNTIKYISNYWSPIKNLSFLAENSISETQSPSFLFFENRDGFNFRSLERLYKAEPMQKFIMDRYTRDDFPKGGNILNIMEDYKRIGEINYITNYDYIDRVRSGMLASKLISYDSTKKTYTVKNYNAAKRFSSQNHLNKYPVFSQNVIARANAQHILFPRAFETFTSFGDTTNARILQERISFMKMAESHKVQISVPGRCDYTVGMVVDLTLYQNKPIKKTDRQDELIDKVNSGKYLVSAIFHDIKSNGHDCWLELIKDSMMKEV